MRFGNCTITCDESSTYTWKYEAPGGMIRSMIGTGFATEDEAREALIRTIGGIMDPLVGVP